MLPLATPYEDTTTMKIILGILLMLSFCAWLTARVVISERFDMHCSGYLKRAADANTVDLAKVELARAVSYLDEHRLTSGYTSVFYRTPDEDVGFWYGNLKASQGELDALPANASALERSNVLMKLRETLTDNSKNGTSLTIPEGISVYPSNGAWAFFGVATLVIAAVGAIVFMVGLAEH